MMRRAIAMTAQSDTVFLFDVDNTLLDNDAVVLEYRNHVARECGTETAARYWTIFEGLRQELGYADYLGALQRYRLERLHDPSIYLLSSFLLDYPFADRLYSGAMDVLAEFGARGRTVILTDGDVVFQPRKIEVSGIQRAVQNRVLIRIHKERELDCVEFFHPSRHYVLIDDKLAILAAVKRIWGNRVTTVFVRQGHYAFDAKQLASTPPPDVTIRAIGELRHYDATTLHDAARGVRVRGTP